MRDLEFRDIKCFEILDGKRGIWMALIHMFRFDPMNI